MESRSLCGCATATGPVACMQPDKASAVMAAMIDNRNARATRTGAIPKKRDSSSLAPVMVNKPFLRATGVQLRDPPRPALARRGDEEETDQALTPAPIGHDTPVPPSPQ